MRRVAALTLVATLVIGGCSVSSGEIVDSPTTEAPTTTATERIVAPSPSGPEPGSPEAFSEMDAWMADMESSLDRFVAILSDIDYYLEYVNRVELDARCQALRDEVTAVVSWPGLPPIEEHQPFWAESLVLLDEAAKACISYSYTLDSDDYSTFIVNYDSAAVSLERFVNDLENHYGGYL